MAKRFLVTQYHEDGRYSHSKDYPFYFIAAIVAWVMAGSGLHGEKFYTVIRDVED